MLIVAGLIAWILLAGAAYATYAGQLALSAWLCFTSMAASIFALIRWSQGER